MITEKLLHINVNEHTEDKPSGNGKTLTYLSWVWAIKELLEIAPDMTYEVVRQANGLPYVCDPAVGYMVTTRMTIEGVTKEMWLPVMDSRNNAMKPEPYEVRTRFGVNTVAAATMMDINKAIMRCLVKNAAMFGLGLYIYAGQDLPDDLIDDKPMPELKKAEPAKERSAKAASVTVTKAKPERVKLWNSFANTNKVTEAEMVKIVEQLKREGKVRDVPSAELTDEEFTAMICSMQTFMNA